MPPASYNRAVNIIHYSRAVAPAVGARLAALLAAAVAVAICASCRTTDAEKRILSDLDGLKSEVARVSARQDAVEREIAKLTGDSRVMAADAKDARDAAKAAAAPGGKSSDIRVPNLKVFKVRDDTPPSKKARTVEVVSTPERPFGDAGPEVAEGGAAHLLHRGEVPGVPTRAEEGADPGKMYARALQQFSEIDCGNAVVTFEDFVRLNPSHPKASQAVFYVGECYFNRGEYAIALSEFTRLAEQYRGAKQVPMALYKAGMCLKSLKDVRGARQIFTKVKEDFSGEEAAVLAEKELAKLK